MLLPGSLEFCIEKLKINAMVKRSLFWRSFSKAKNKIARIEDMGF
jgi:hypothetical protein